MAMCITFPSIYFSSCSNTYGMTVSTQTDVTKKTSYHLRYTYMLRIYTETMYCMNNPSFRFIIDV